MVLRKCPKCRETVNCDSYSCPRCGVIFREYRTKRLIFWLMILIAAGWVMHRTVQRHLPWLHRPVASPAVVFEPTDSR